MEFHSSLELRVVEIETEFDISFEPEEMAEMKDFATVLELVEGKKGWKMELAEYEKYNIKCSYGLENLKGFRIHFWNAYLAWWNIQKIIPASLFKFSTRFNVVFLIFYKFHFHPFFPSITSARLQIPSRPFLQVQKKYQNSVSSTIKFKYLEMEFHFLINFSILYKSSNNMNQE